MAILTEARRDVDGSGWRVCLKQKVEVDLRELVTRQAQEAIDANMQPKEGTYGD